MKLYYAPGACSLADHIALREGGLDAELVKVDLRAKTTETGQDFNAINPKGYVPALALDEGGVLTENIAVLSYLADRSGRLMPASGIERWRTLETTAFISTEVHKNFKPLFTPDATDADKDAAKAMLAKRFGTLAEQLGDRGFLIGEEMTIADCYLCVMLMWAKKNGVEIPASLVAYQERLMQRPAVQQALREEGLT